MNVTTKPALFTLLALLTAALLAACGGGSGPKFPETVVIGEDDILPVPITPEYVVGENRFAFGLVGPEGPIVDADVRLAFYFLGDGQEERRFELQAISRVPARDAGIDEQIEHVHADGTVHIHFNVGEEIGIYTAKVEFDRPGEWGVEIQMRKGSLNETLRPRFHVGTQSSTPPIGHDAPRSRNLTIHDVDDIALIDSSAEPTEDMHRMTIADAIDAGRPTLVLFAVPGYCASRMCGPVMEIMRLLYPEWSDRVEFIHVEFYENPGTPEATPVEAVYEWGLRGEPWFFLIDADGKVAAKFHGPTAKEELEEALARVVSPD